MSLDQKRQSEQPGKRQKILIIDDQRSAALCLKGLLQQLGEFRVDTAHTYQQALDRCQQTHYDLLFVDYHLTHGFNGFELISLLRKRNYLSALSGLIMMSGDSSMEVILTSMAAEPDSFLTKPLALAPLKTKLAEVRSAMQARAPIYRTLLQTGLPAAIACCRQQLQQSGHDPKLESLLLDLLITARQWPAVAQLLSQLKHYPPTHKTLLAEARLLHHQGQRQQAIRLLKQLLHRSPLIIEAYDYLSHYQEENQQYYDALKTAETALAFTPGISHRALTAAQLAADLNRHEDLLAAGRTLADKLPIMDISWIICFAEFTAIFEKLYFAQPSNSLRRQLRQALESIHRRALRRVTPFQAPFLISFGHLTGCRLQLGSADSVLTTRKARRRLLIGLAPHFDTMSRLPSVMLADALPALAHFGETRLIGDICRALKVRDQFDGHSRHRLDEIKADPLLGQAVKNLERQLNLGFQAMSDAPDVALMTYEQILREYPLCSEAHLGRLDCLLRLGAGQQPKLRRSLNLISDCPLPTELHQWRKRLLHQLITPNPASPIWLRQLGLHYLRRTERYGELPAPAAMAS
ncbi:response regulator [Photobacterium sp. TY1-4]|uniref:response regulator n=1 Tax=Photobacterium sp. TY1-4 TaxID=2899122 RepID=UPI0021BEE66B|nr:response regulator [Photobacterium sp. TY1-4]UXI01984.1 response regulator [Photobacterium sp. TY1-4]